MAHTYVISSMTAVGDQLTVVGSVDGQSVTVQTWLSALAKLPSAASVQAFLAPLMTAALPQAAVSVPSSAIGTFSA